MKPSDFKLNPERERLKEMPVVLETVDWGTLGTEESEPETPGAGNPAPNPEDDPLADF